MAENWLSKSWLFEIVDSKTGKVDASFTLVLPPQSYQIKEKARVSITKTFGNAFIDDYGPDNIEITIKGISGTAHVFPTFTTTGKTSTFNPQFASAGIEDTIQTQGYNHRSAFYTFRNEIMRYRDAENFDSKEMRVYDLYDEQAYKCVLLEFTLDRNQDKPFWYPFTISLFVYARLDSKQAAKPQKIDISGDPFSIINFMDNMLSWYTTVSRAVQSVINGAARVSNDLNLVESRLDSFLTRTRALIESPLILSKQLIDTTFAFGATIRSAYTDGKITFDTYMTLLEVWQGMVRESMALYGFSIQQGSQQTKEEVMPVDRGLSIDTSGVVSPDREQVLNTFSFDSVNIYTIKGQDTLQTIAQAEMGDENLWPFIASINRGINNNDDLVVGEQLYVPSTLEALSKDSFIMTEDALRDPYGADIRIDGSGNIVVQENSDAALISGVANVQQSVDMRLNTPLGSILKQTAFGLSAQPGGAGTESSLKYLRMGLTNALLQDPRIKSVSGIQIEMSGDQVRASMDIYLVGAETSLPASVVF